LKVLKKTDSIRHCGVAWTLFSLSLLLLVFWSFRPLPLHGASVTDGAERHQLPNGLTVILKEDRSSPVASIQVWVKTGSANETEEEAGITHFIEHMIFKGTPTRETGEIAKIIESSGGRINAYTTFDRTVYYVKIPSHQLLTGMDVLLDAIQHSVFDPNELKKEKEVVLEEYRRSLDMPRTQLVWDLMDLAYEKHPYGRPVIGYEKTIRSFDREAVLEYIDKWYAPRNITLVAVGDFDADKALTAIQRLTQDFPERTLSERTRESEPPQGNLRQVVQKKDVQQVYLEMAWHIPPLTHRDIPALDILEIILSHGKSARLYRRLKMEQNLVHSIHAGAWALADPGLFFVDATLSAENLNSTLQAMGQELRKVAGDPIPASEMAKAKRIAEADFLFDLESVDGQARTLGFFETMTGDMNHTDAYLKRLRRVTASDVQRVAMAYLRPENLSVGILVPERADVPITQPEIVDLLSTTLSVPAVQTTAAASSETLPSAPVLTTLPNGMRLIVQEDPRLPLVSLVGVFLGGTRLEPEGRWGISNFAAEMLTRGTSRRTASEIASMVESWAGKLDSFSGRNSIGISAKFLAKDFYPGLELVADVLQNSSFPKAEMEKVRTDVLARIRAKKDRPTPQLFDLFYETLYTGHPYGHPRTGTKKTILGITRAQVENWYGSLAGPANFVLAVVGDVNGEQLVPVVESLFWGSEARSVQMPKTPSRPTLKDPRSAHLERPGAQTHLIVGFLGADLKSDAHAAMALVDTALSGMGGRLFFELRDKMSLAYSVTAFRQPGLETGAFGVYIACDPSKTSLAREAIFRELEKIRQQGLSPEELRDAKNYLLGNLLMGLETSGEKAMHMALDELYGLGYDHIHRYMAEIEGVTAEEIQRAAERFILLDRYVLVTVGPGGTGTVAHDD
jgi:zinc protease